MSPLYLLTYLKGKRMFKVYNVAKLEGTLRTCFCRILLDFWHCGTFMNFSSFALGASQKKSPQSTKWRQKILKYFYFVENWNSFLAFFMLPIQKVYVTKSVFFRNVGVLAFYSCFQSCETFPTNCIFECGSFLLLHFSLNQMRKETFSDLIKYWHREIIAKIFSCFCTIESWY